MGSQRGGSGVTSGQQQSAAKAFQDEARVTKPSRRGHRGSGGGGGASGSGGTFTARSAGVGGGSGGGGGTGDGPEAVASLVGFVENSRHRPLAGATAALDGESRVTAADGSFEFLNVAPRQYTLTVSMPGYRASRRQVSLPPGREIAVTVTLAVSS